MISTSLSVNFKDTPDPLAEGSPAQVGLTSVEDMFFALSGCDTRLHRVIRTSHVNVEYGSVGHDNAVELNTFPGLIDDGADGGAGAPVQDPEGQPIQLSTLHFLLVRVDPIVAYEPAFATSSLTSTATIPVDGDLFVIGSKTYTAKTTLTPTEGQVLIGGSVSAFLLNLSRAILHTGTPGTDYSCAAAHPESSAAATVTTSTGGFYLPLTALVGGVSGNALVTTTTATTLSFPGGTFAGGAATASPLTAKPLAGAVTVDLADGIAPGGTGFATKLRFDKTGYQIIAIDGGWTPAAASKITVSFDATVPLLPATVNAIVTLLFVGNAA